MDAARAALRQGAAKMVRRVGRRYRFQSSAGMLRSVHPGRRRWVVMRVVLCAGLGLAAVVLSAVLGYPNLSGALFLSGLIVAVVWYVRSGALAPTWLHKLDRASVRRLRWIELAKALVVLGLGLDFLQAWSSGFGHSLLGYGVITRWEPVVVALLAVVAAGTFLTRWFAACLVGRD